MFLIVFIAILSKVDGMLLSKKLKYVNLYFNDVYFILYYNDTLTTIFLVVRYTHILLINFSFSR